MKSYKDHLLKSSDLVTSYNETRAGFIAIALEKNKRATPYIEEARILQTRIKSVSSPHALCTIPDLRNGLIAAAGISDKSAGHLGEDGCSIAIEEFVEKFLLPAGDKYKEEFIFRYLLTKGDSLGGSMRNIVGTIAQRKLNSIVLAALRLNGKAFKWLHESSRKWIASDGNPDDMENAKGLFWVNPRNQNRVLLYNITVPIIKNNIDIILLDSVPDKQSKTIISDPHNYIALGELKGGIDPAGADEHWKTAKSAIDRIVSAFKKHKLSPAIFFVGAAIEKKMSMELWNDLRKNYISNAANLTRPDHIASLAEWLLDQ